MIVETSFITFGKTRLAVLISIKTCNNIVDLRICVIQLRFQSNEYQFTIYWCDVYNIWQYIDCESNKIIKLFNSAVNI